MELDPTVTTASIAALETMVNAALNYDPGSKRALARLEGQVLAVESTAPGGELFIAPATDGVRLMGAWSGDVTTRLRGPLPALLQLAASDTTTLAGSGVEVMGSTALLSNLQRIARDLEIDWEEALTRLLGDVLGHQLADQLRSQLQWLGQRLSSSQRLLSEYLTEELKALPAKAELEDFSEQVDQLRLGVDRAAGRIALIQQALLKKPAADNQPHQE